MADEQEETKDQDENVEGQEVKEGKLGKLIATIGAGMFAVSIVLVYAGISGKSLHNILQLGGLGALIIGLILWKAVKI